MDEDPPATRVEAIDAIEAALGEEGFRSYCRGHALRCIWRAGMDGDEWRGDLKEAIHFLRHAVGE